jgi:hypothetical protein
MADAGVPRYHTVTAVDSVPHDRESAGAVNLAATGGDLIPSASRPAPNQQT